jgi:hypothetical protein
METGNKKRMVMIICWEDQPESEPKDWSKIYQNDGKDFRSNYKFLLFK